MDDKIAFSKTAFRQKRSFVRARTQWRGEGEHSLSLSLSPVGETRKKLGSCHTPDGGDPHYARDTIGKLSELPKAGFGGTAVAASADGFLSRFENLSSP